MVGIAECSPQLFPPGEASSSRLVGISTEGEARAGPSRVLGDASPINSDDVESVVCSLLSDEEPVTLEEEEDEDIPTDYDKEALAEWYMPPKEAGSGAAVEIDDARASICNENKFLVKGLIDFAYPDDYQLVLPAEGDKITNCPPVHVAIYAHSATFPPSFSLGPFYC